MADPEFPNRPDHPDFWRLAAIVSHHDEIADEDPESFTRVLARITDAPFDAVTYVAWQRAMRVIAHRRGTFGAGRRGDGVDGALVAMWLDGFAAGVAFQKGESDEDHGG